MPLSPEDVTAAGLRRRWRGYDRKQVGQLLTQVKSSYTAALERLADAAEDAARARAERAELDHRLGTLSDSARQDAERLRQEAIADAAAVRARAEQAAELIIEQAEQTATAHRSQPQLPYAHHQVEAAEPCVEDIDRRSARPDVPSPDRWEEPAMENEARSGPPRTDERSFGDRIQQMEAALGGLRSQVALLEQIHQAEQALAALRIESTARSLSSLESPQPTNGDHR